MELLSLRRAHSSINPVAIKASAGTVFKAPIVRVDTVGNALDQLIQNRFEILGLETSGESIFPSRIAGADCTCVGE